MEVATLIGLIGGFLVIIIAILMGGNILGFVDVPSIFITFGGSLMAVLIKFSFDQFTGAFKALSHILKKNEMNTMEVINSIVAFAKKARREGLLALEDDVHESKDEFLKKGIQLIVDGTDPELVRNILEIELSFVEERHRSNRSFFDTWGALSPAFGMIGTVIGLIQMMSDMEDASKIGPAMAVALLTTLYGAIWANLVCIPISGKMSKKSADEIFLKQIMIEGILSIQAGENPRIIEEKLNAFLSIGQRNALGQQGKEEGETAEA